MKPIEQRLDLNFSQALRCAEYRLPKHYGFSANGFAQALGLRYGLFGAAAAHHLLSCCEPLEEEHLQEKLSTWPAAVFDHVRLQVIPRLEAGKVAHLPVLVSTLADQPVKTYLAMYRRLCPLDWALTIAKDVYLDENRAPMFSPWMFWKHGKGRKALEESAEESFRFALGFYERRKAGLEELPEIALIGE